MASKRKVILFPFYNNYFTSTAIIIYQTNILRTLNYLADDVKPEIVIWHTNKSPIQEIKDTNYPLLKFINIKSVHFRLTKLLFILLNRIGLAKFSRINRRYDLIYPAYPDPFLMNIKEKIYWKADFQESYYPEYFKDYELKWNNSFMDFLKNNPDSKLVLSSYNALGDIKKFYPHIQNPLFVFRFVSHIPSLKDEDFKLIRKNFGISKPFFIVCNQYWPHKNHIVIIKALSVLKLKMDLPFHFVFTGKTSSIRGNEYFLSLKNAIQDNGLMQDIIITDFLKREDQLMLMKESLAVVQPTLFEGWSTVIEDAKALNKFIVASNIVVNQEQLNKNVIFFEPHDHFKLSQIIQSIFQNRPYIENVNYDDSILESMKDIVKIFGLK
ncbi:MAG: glycosyltransferase [Bacteroidetes bacterium]|nr:glycosyltransferase [Bacteroidota bacterium]